MKTKTDNPQSAIQFHWPKFLWVEICSRNYSSEVRVWISHPWHAWSDNSIPHFFFYFYFCNTIEKQLDDHGQFWRCINGRRRYETIYLKFQLSQTNSNRFEVHHNLFLCLKLLSIIFFLWKISKSISLFMFIFGFEY